MADQTELRYDDKVVLVTGGARGVGAGIAQEFLARGAHVVICARNPPEQPVRAGEACAEFAPCDVRDPDEVDRMMTEIHERHGRLDVLVNNAGGAPFKDTDSASPRFHRKIVELNLLAPLLLSQHAYAVMRRQEEGGVVINVCSLSGTRPSPGTAAYGAAKAGLDNLTASLAMEWAPKVRVNALDVGPVRTELAEMHYGDEEGIRAVGETIPLGRMAEPRDVGNCAVMLASPLASYVTGARLLVHGGGEKPPFLSAANVTSNVDARDQQHGE